MSSPRTVPRRRQRIEDDEDVDETPSRHPKSASHTKRLRVDSPQESDDNDQEDDNDTTNVRDEDESVNSDNKNENEEGVNAPEPAATQTRFAQTENNTQQPMPSSAVDNGHQNGSGSGSAVGPNGYKPGAIVRIKLTDFVTYTSAEFFPGPKLNMVIGPNGTGKSTLVCAICLGLGWGPQHLGRAKDPGEFVKHGCREATIEIELAGPPKLRRNPVVCRTIKRDGNKSSFTVNGKPASRAQVLKLAQSFSIQIDNLCQFLPQDKVSEFAALTPVELLHSTQRAAAGPEMIKFHDDLKKLRAEQKKLQMDNKGDRDLLANLENRQEMQRADVERMRQRAQIKRKIEMLQFARPIVRYKEAHTASHSAKEERSRIEREHNELKASLEPALREVNAKKHYAFQLDEVVKHQKQVVDRADATASEIGKKIEEYEDSMKDLSGQIEAEKKSGISYRQEASKITQTINNLKRQLNEEPVEFDIGSYNERIREIRRQIRDIDARAWEIKERRRPLFEKLNEKNARIKQAEEQLKNLDSQSGRQESKLAGTSQDTLKAYKWLLENQNRFENEVFPPPIICCSIKDPKYGDAVESLLQRTDFMTFTTQSRNDFRTLQRALSTEVRVSDVAIRTCSVPLNRFQPPIPNEELRRLGFDGWAKDYLNGPEPVLAMFCSENRLHQTPITLRDISDDEYTIMESGSLSSWVAGKQAYQVVRRREYGPGATSTRVRQIRPARMWTSQPVEASAKRELEQSIEAWRQEMNEVQEHIDADRAVLARLNRDRDDNDRARIELEQEKSAKQTALINYKAIPEKINQQEAKQRDLQKFFREIKTRVMNIRSQQDQVAIKKAEATIDYANAVENLREQHEKLVKFQVRQIEALSDVDVLKDRNSEHQRRLDAKAAELKQAIEIVQTRSAEAKRLYKEAQEVARVSKTHQRDLADLLATLADHTMEQLEADVDSEKARLELTHGGNANVIKEFEDREKQIQALRRKLADFQNELGKFGDAINEVQAKWEPKLDALVQKISDAFSDSFARIGCAGQVSLDKAEDEDGPDFEQWSIQIHVKFRENENLSLLDSHRQSGGERAVSTIFYLMALQSLSASPFRVVDEINQGMDPRNERMVHERLVDIACATGENENDGGRGGGQYFLITPKLLNGLAYKPGMKVLCIVSGEHMPQDYGLVDFGRAVRKMKEIVASRSGKGSGKGKGRAIGVGGSSNNGVDVHA